jgi:hypothetical protein
MKIAIDSFIMPSILSNLQDHNLFFYQQIFNRDYCHRTEFLFNLQKGKLLNEKNLRAMKIIFIIYFCVI